MSHLLMKIEICVLFGTHFEEYYQWIDATSFGLFLILTNYSDELSTPYN